MVTSTTGRRPQGRAETVEPTDGVRQVLAHHPTVGLVVGWIGDGEPAFACHGLEDLTTRRPITGDTVFRVGSITKTFTAVAVLQLSEEGLVDVEAPVQEYLRAYRLVSDDPTWAPVTLRHLLTHTSGIPDVLRPAELFHPGWGPFMSRPPVLSVAFGESLPDLAEYYRQGVRVVQEPGTAFAYSNHGFATLGQVVEDVTGTPLDAYLRERVFLPLGMTDTDLVRTGRIRSRLATGHAFGRRGPQPTPDRDWIGGGGGGLYSTGRDLARYAAALLAAGAGATGRILRTETLARMFRPHYQPDHRLAGMGLGFFLHEAGGRRLVGHDGILPGFNASLLLAPDAGQAVLGLTNGSPYATAWLPAAMESLLHDRLGAPPAAPDGFAPQHPEIWRELCGRYHLPRVGDMRGRAMMGGGLDIVVRGGRLTMRVLTPVPALLRGLALLPDDPDDPYVFRLDLSGFGMSPVRLVFARTPDDRRVIHTDLGGQPASFYRREPVPRGSRRR